MRKLVLAVIVAFALALTGTVPALAGHVAHNPDANAHSGGKSCFGQFVAFAVQPHGAFDVHGLHEDAAAHGLSVPDFVDVLQAHC